MAWWGCGRGAWPCGGKEAELSGAWAETEKRSNIQHTQVTSTKTSKQSRHPFTRKNLC